MGDFMKVAIIGGGISGLVAAINIDSNNEVTIFERNSSLLKKLLLTGNGKCNYWNQDIHIRNYDTDHYDNLDTILKNHNHLNLNLHYLLFYY